MLPEYLPDYQFTFSPTSGYAPLVVSFDASGSSDQDGYIVFYSWSFGDGYSSSSESPQHTYSAPGTYFVRLAIRDNNDGHQATASASIHVTTPQYSFTDSSKPIYPQTADGARVFVFDVRPPNWTYSVNLHVQMPDVSYAALRGDCDDYAVMLSYYLEEYWGYDTFVVILRPTLGSNLEDHAVCFVRRSQLAVDLPGTFSCSSISVIDHPNGYRYYPIDWEPCPGWTWSDYYLDRMQIIDKKGKVLSPSPFLEFSARCAKF